MGNKSPNSRVFRANPIYTSFNFSSLFAFLLFSIKFNAKYNKKEIYYLFCEFLDFFRLNLRRFSNQQKKTCLINYGSFGDQWCFSYLLKGKYLHKFIDFLKIGNQTYIKTQKIKNKMCMCVRHSIEMRRLLNLVW